MAKCPVHSFSLEASLTYRLTRHDKRKAGRQSALCMVILTVSFNTRMTRQEGCCYGQGPPSKKHVVKPERVLMYTKKMEVRWRALEADLQGVRSLDDVIRIDLDFLLRRALTLVLCPKPCSAECPRVDIPHPPLQQVGFMKS